MQKLAKKIEEEYLPRLAFLFDMTPGIEIEVPIHFVFSDYPKGQDHEVYFQGYYTSLYKEKFGYEAIWVNIKDIKELEMEYHVAHELFHVFYRKINSEPERWPERWIEEGLASLLGYVLTGFIPQFQVSKYFEKPNVSLENFPEGKAKYYGHSFLFFYFLYKHFIKTASLRDLIKAKHPKEFFDEKTWKVILREFSIAKLLNTIYLHDQKHYSLRPILGNVTASKEFSPWAEPGTGSLYIEGSEENRQKVTRYASHPEASGASPEAEPMDLPKDLIYIIKPKFGKLRILDTYDPSIIGKDPYLIIVNLD